MNLEVVAETENGALTESALECVEEAREVADAFKGDVHVWLPGHGVAGLADELAAHGADLVTVVEMHSEQSEGDEARRHFSADAWLAALEPLLHREAPSVILAPDTARARAWLPRLALRWRVPLLSGCVQLRAERDGRLEIARPVYRGALEERWVYSSASTLLVTLLPGARGIGLPRGNRQAQVNCLTPSLTPEAVRDRTVKYLPPDPRTVDISEAERIVAGGLGVGGPEGMNLLQQLAERLGAAVGGTRVLVDRGWLPFERQIGTTGKTVAPRLYVALGISGASQHTAGMSSSKTVIVVNRDRTAPMFGLADLGVVDDMRQIVPALLKRLGEA